MTRFWNNLHWFDSHCQLDKLPESHKIKRSK